MQSKRKLTDKEIDDLVSGIKVNSLIPEETAKCMEISLKNSVIQQLKKVNVYPHTIKRIKDHITETYFKSLIAPTSFIGVQTALDLGSLYTQSVLNIFHSTGLSRLASSGLSRLEELTGLKKTPKVKNCVIYLKKEWYTGTDTEIIRRLRQKYHKDIEYKNLEYFVKKVEVEWKTQLSDEENDWYDTYFSLYNLPIGRKKNGRWIIDYNWVIRLEIDRQKLAVRDLLLSELCTIINDNFIDIYAVCSWEHLAILDIYVNTSNIDDAVSAMNREEVARKKKEKSEENKIAKKASHKSKSNGDIFSSLKIEFDTKGDSEDDESLTETKSNLESSISQAKTTQECLITTEIQNYFYISKIVLPELLYLKVCGIEGIDECFIEKSKSDYVIVTEGSNLLELFADPDIDYTRTYSSFVWEIYEILGIEAARTFLYNSINESFNSNGFVHKRYSNLLVDWMTYNSKLSSVNRHGIDRSDAGPLAKMSFEENIGNISTSSFNAEVDNTKGVSASVILGKSIHQNFDLIIDFSNLPKKTS